MSVRRMERALVLLAKPGAVLVRSSEGGFGVLPGGDRRRRPVARLDAQVTRSLEAEGTIAKNKNGDFSLTEAGRARVLRNASRDGEGYQAQHAPIVERAVMDGAGDVRIARGFDVHAPLRRLAALRNGRGEAWLDARELAAAERLRHDWHAAEIGLLRGSDWRAPPHASAPRASSHDGAMAARCDARRRVEDRLRALAPPLRRVIERVCLQEEGVEALERAEGWPHRSGKLALKLGLAQLAAMT